MNYNGGNYSLVINHIFYGSYIGVVMTSSNGLIQEGNDQYFVSETHNTCPGCYSVDSVKNSRYFYEGLINKSRSHYVNDIVFKILYVR